MMFKIFWRFLRDRKISLTIYCLAAILFTWMYVGFFPTFSEQSDQFEEIFTEDIAIFEALGVETVGFSTIEGFMALEFYSFVWPLMIILVLVSMAAGAMAQDIERGTIENYLAHPISRLQFFAGRYLAGLAVLVIFTLVSVFAIVPFAELYDVDYSVKAFVSIAPLGFLFGLAVYSLAMFFSSLFSERSKVYLWMGSLLILMYVAEVISNLSDSVEDVHYFSFFYFFDHNDALLRGEVANESVLVFVGVTIVFTLLAGWRFHKRDIAK